MKEYYIYYGKPGMTIVSTPIQIEDTKIISNLMTAALNSNKKKK